MHEAVFENGFRDFRHAIRPSKHCHKLRLHIRGKSRMRRSADFDGFGAPCHLEPNPIGANINNCPHFPKLQNHSFQISGHTIRNQHIAVRSRCRTEERSGLNTVSDHSVFGPVKTFNPFNHQCGRTSTRDLCTHSIEAIGQVNHFRFTRSIFNDRRSLCEHCSHHQIFRTGDRHHIGGNMRRLQTGAFYDNIAVVNFNRST